MAILPPCVAEKSPTISWQSAKRLDSHPFHSRYRICWVAPRGRDRGLDLKRIGMQRVVRLAMLAVLATSLTGCGSKPGYPTAKPVSALNQPGECAYCHGKIELVTDENLVTCDGVQYIVCNEECAAGQKIAAGR